MKVALRETVPSVEDIAAGLDLHQIHPALADAEVAERQRAEDLERVRGDLARAIDAVDSVGRDVHAGRAAAADLEQALRQRQAVAAGIVAAERSLAEATASRARGEQVAREKLREEAKRRNDNLERIAGCLAPALDALNDAELALDTATRRALRSDSSGLPSVVWPMCLAHRRR